MPFKSKAQQRFMFAAEARGELPSGTAKRWAKHTKDIKGLPERKKESAKYEARLLPVRESRWEGAVRGSGSGTATAGLLSGAALGTLLAAGDIKRGKLLPAAKKITGAGGTGWFLGALGGAARGAAKPKTKLKLQLRRKGESLKKKKSSVLSERGRQQIKSKSFVFPKQKKYPIHDREHARNALARVAQFGNKSMQAKVRAAVARKYPGLELTQQSKPVKTPTVKYSPPTRHPHTGAKKMAAEAGARHALEILVG